MPTAQTYGLVLKAHTFYYLACKVAEPVTELPQHDGERI